MAIDLGKQVGPLPLGAWIAVVGTGLGVSLYTKRQQAGTEIVEDVGGVPGVGTGATGGWQYNPAPAPTTNAPITTNEAWGREAVNYLIAQGYDAARADLAVRKYLAAENLSVQEYALIRLALQHLGSPPVPLPPGQITVPGPITVPNPPPPPPPAPPAARIRYHRVVGGDSLRKLAIKYYGIVNADRWIDIYNANREILGNNAQFTIVNGVVYGQRPVAPLGSVLVIP